MPSNPLTALRLAAQAISASTFTSPVEVVRHMLAMQGQDFGGAKWSVGLRLPGSTDATIEASLAAGEIVRSWPMRGTLHLTAPEDLWWLLQISAVRQKTWAAKRRGDLGITGEDLARAGDVAVAEMTGGRVIRRDRLIEAWEAAGVSTAGQRAYHLLWNLGHDRLIVFGPVDGKQHTFALFEEWVTTHRKLEGDEALAEFATRYFYSHGPATVRDFAWWASITLGDARKGVAAATGLRELDIDGTSYYLREELEPAPSGVYALPGFDEYLLGYSDRSPVLAAEFSNRIVPGNNGMFLPTFVVDGQVVGTWKRRDLTKKSIVQLEQFTPQRPASLAGFETAMTRYSQFLERPVEVEL